MIQLHPYNLGSRSAMALKGYLTEHGIRAIVSHRLASQRQRFIVGWGAKPFDFLSGGNHVRNHPTHTKALSCKKRFFDAVSDEAVQYIPQYTDDVEIARGWLDTVVVRHTTTGSGGDGIVIVPAGEDIPHAPLYVRYQKKTHEYRVHCFRKEGEVGWSSLHLQRKVFVPTEERPEPLNWQVRNHTQGFIFQTEESVPVEVHTACLSVLGSFPSLHFAALDVIYHEPTRKALVLEGNTAPGLEGPRLQVYGDYLISEYRSNF